MSECLQVLVSVGRDLRQFIVDLVGHSPPLIFLDLEQLGAERGQRLFAVSENRHLVLQTPHE